MRLSSQGSQFIFNLPSNFIKQELIELEKDNNGKNGMLLLTEIISKENKVNMKSISFDTTDGIFEGHIRVLVLDTEHLELLTRKFEEIEGVQRVVRWDMQDDLDI